MNGNHHARLHVHLTATFAVTSAQALARWGAARLLVHVHAGTSPAHQLPACAARPGALADRARAHGLHPQPPTHKEDAWGNTGKSRGPAGEAAR
jgi:hypothetical protein